MPTKIKKQIPKDQEHQISTSLCKQCNPEAYAKMKKAEIRVTDTPCLTHAGF